MKGQTVEIFSGTESFSHVAETLGYLIYTVDNEDRHCPSLVHDMTKPMPQELKDMIDRAYIVWMSPPCTTFSMASGNRHWSEDREPLTEDALIGRKLLEVSKEIAEYCIEHGKIFFIENPKGRAVWFLPDEWRKEAWYCKYGEWVAKPTYIWTNLHEWEPKMCHNHKYDENGNVVDRKCHHAVSRRGMRTGTQGKKDATVRGAIPPFLFYEIFEIIEARGGKIPKIQEESDVEQYF